MRCRLCLCLVDKQCGYASLVDQAFSNMVKQVMNFVISTAQSIAEQQYSLPVLVCLQCSKTVRDFYSFCKLVEANQITQRSEYANRNNAMSIDELLECIKPDPELEDGKLNDVVQDSLVMSASEEDPENDGEIFSTATENVMDKGITVSKEILSICVDKGDVIKSIASMERRISIMTKKLDTALQKLPIPGNVKDRRVSFEFSPITNEVELASLNEHLGQKEYFQTFLDWLNCEVSMARTGDHRMHEALDLIFSRPFFAECSWTGKSVPGKMKLALINYKQVINIFRIIGSTRGSKVSDLALLCFFQRKLKYAKRRAHSPVRRSTCRPTRIKYPVS
ncbi:uncharacterized protein LOC131262133 [Anopheles coustani]|uniref:uncharacterized protein LOC131262133 n=1 Tax=Anopheles coustani TaxID=139045 RepID=UPI0026597A59|nr:uncharacterized protein LOC131262133 [Anopheles coustani]